jgi:hypothetical protein
MGLPAASFGFLLTVDTLAVDQIPQSGIRCVEDLHLQEGAPCRVYPIKKPVSQPAFLNPYDNDYLIFDIL